jgi:hypothetical protein
VNLSREQSCDGKRRFPNRELAVVALDRMVHRKGDRGLGVYRCRHCQTWHLGHGHLCAKPLKCRRKGAA